jgi:hypothetical protein
MGFPANKLASEYYFPVYDNVALDSQLRVSNVGGASTNITIYAGAAQIDTYSLAAGAATRKNYAAVNTGPLQVVSSAMPVLSTVRLLYNTALFSSFYEITGLPGDQLYTEYWFQWYNNVAMSSEVRLAVP